MAQIALDSTGIPKASLVAGAYEFCGLNGAEYERTPEEVATGMRHLNSLMARLLAKGVDLGFAFPTYGTGFPEEPSGIPDSAQEPVMAMLAQRLAPTLGAELTADCRAILASSAQDLYAENAASPPSITPAYRLPSSGVRHQRFTTLTPSDASIIGDPGDLASLAGG